MVSTGIYDFVSWISGLNGQSKEAWDAKGNGSKLRIVFQNISVTYGDGAEAGASYDMFILFAAPAQK